MRAYVALSGGPFTEAGLVELAERLAPAVPLPADDLVARTWSSPSGCLAILGWSNEGDHAPLGWWQATNESVQALTGYLSQRPALGPRTTVASTEAALAATSGVYSLVLALGSGDELAAWNTLPRSDAVYWQQAGDAVAVSNRPLLAHLAARGANRPAYNLRALPAFLNTGFHAGEETPFEGLHVLPPASRLLVRGSTVEVRGWSGPALDDGERAVEAALLAAVGQLGEPGGPVVCTLTGGRDSRLVAAALAAAGVPFRATTTGDPRHPDVIVARLVAERLGIEHTAIGANPTEVLADVEDRTRQTLRAVDGLLSPYDNIGPRLGAYVTETIVNGLGGEILRGGYLKAARPADLADPGAFVRRAWLANETLLTADAREAYRLTVERLATPLPGEPPPELLDRLYLELRAGRWGSASRLSGSAKYPLGQPLFDDRLVRAARRVPLEERVSERLAFRLIERLRPDLLDLPLANARWKFERHGPVDGFPGWDRRAAVLPPETGERLIEWRRTKGGPLDRRFRERLLDGDPHATLFEVVDRRALERLLPARSRYRLHVRSGPEAQFLWAAYAGAVLLSDDWLAPVESAQVIRVRIRPTLAERTGERVVPFLTGARRRLARALRSRRPRPAR